MFLRSSDKLCELWTLDAEHKVGAHDYGQECPSLNRFNDTEFKFRRVEVSPRNNSSIVPIALNPMLQYRVCTSVPNTLRAACGENEEWADYRGWIDIFQDSDASLWNTYLTDPPCHRASVQNLILCFGEAPPPTHYAGYEYWTAANREDGMWLGEHPMWSHETRAYMDYGGYRGFEITSDSGLKLGDVLNACLTTRGWVSSSVTQ
jgi:hypothetical protein